MVPEEGENPPGFIEMERRRHEEMFDALCDLEVELMEEIGDLKVEIKKASSANEPTEDMDESLADKKDQLKDLRKEKAEHEKLMKRTDEEEE